MSNEQNGGRNDPAEKPVLESRRRFIRNSALLGAVSAGAGLGAPAMLASPAAEASVAGAGAGALARALRAADVRIDAARDRFAQTRALPPQQTNGDDLRYARENFYASFTKTLPHDDFGEVDPAAYRALLRAQRTGRPRDFDAIPLDPTATRRLANPQGALRFVYAGLDGHATRMRPAPAFRSKEIAAEMGELYWQALTRDIPFDQYGSHTLIGDAIEDLNAFSETVGPKVGGLVTADTLFRGPTPGDLTGPYISQFLWKDVPYGPSVIVQRYEAPLAVDVMVNEHTWLNVQRGGTPLETLVFDPVPRYLHDNRSLGEYVHRDVLFQAYFNAALILLGMGAVDPKNPYFNGDIGNQGAFTSFGGPWVIDLVTQAGNLALNSAWYQKWLEHRRLRPEAYGGRVHFQLLGQRHYEIDLELLDSAGVSNALTRNLGNGFLPMAFAEGSPTHPAYPAGHATVAGACVTTLKAYFDEDFVIPDPVVSDEGGFALLDLVGGPDLTVGGELNKLASNVAIGRNAAGVHYRSDGVDGLLVGEQQAIVLLQEYSAATNEDFDGFSLTKFDGTPILIRDGRVFPA
ncbi:MAG: vanadium-dependent haloperoxidase [Pseudomonadales bacterium]|jgi:hypothetical protein|nr:vanadium-dependent haloperoxidase [Pseudomonadales bacterium]